MRTIPIKVLCVYTLSLFIFPVFASTSLESYCKDGYYQIPGEKKCSRAPKCGGRSYDDMNKAEFMPNNNDCLDEGRGMLIGDPPNSSAFYGYPPLCCYEMERLKDPEMCIGYWERLWCHPDQCKAIDNSTGCGGGACQCAHAMKGWCEIRKCTLLPPVPIEVRLGLTGKTPTAIPTALPTPIPPQPTAIPTLVPTQIIIPTYVEYVPQVVITAPPVVPTVAISPPYQPSNPISTPSPLVPNNIQPSSFTATIAQLRSIIIQAAIFSKPALDLPANAGQTIITLDQQLETFINGLLASVKSLLVK